MSMEIITILFSHMKESLYLFEILAVKMFCPNPQALYIGSNPRCWMRQRLIDTSQCVWYKVYHFVHFHLSNWDWVSLGVTQGDPWVDPYVRQLISTFMEHQASCSNPVSPCQLDINGMGMVSRWRNRQLCLFPPVSENSLSMPWSGIDCT